MAEESQKDNVTSSLYTLFIIVYLQEMAWVSAPLLISANVFTHACIRQFSFDSLIFSGIVFCFFLSTGGLTAISLYIAHVFALKRRKANFFLPYAFIKFIRILVLSIVSFTILFSPTLIKTYFYASIYGLFETIAGAVALEVTIRCYRETQRMCLGGRRRQSRSDANFQAPTVSKSTLIPETQQELAP